MRAGTPRQSYHQHNPMATKMDPEYPSDKLPWQRGDVVLGTARNILAMFLR